MDNFEYSESDDKVKEGIFKIERDELKQKIMKMISLDKKSELLKSKRDYYQKLCSYEAAFNRPDGKPSIDLGLTGINVEKRCYVTAETHEGPELIGKAKEYAIKFMHIHDVLLNTLEAEKKAGEEAWNEIYEEFNLDRSVKWGINSEKMVIEKRKGSDLGFLGDILGL